MGILTAGEHFIMEDQRLRKDFATSAAFKLCLATLDIHLGAIGCLMIRKLIGQRNSCFAEAAGKLTTHEMESTMGTAIVSSSLSVLCSGQKGVLQQRA